MINVNILNNIVSSIAVGCMLWILKLCVYFLMNIKDRKISFKIKHFNKIVLSKRKMVPNLSIWIDNKKIDNNNISVTDYKIFNNGRKTVYKHHIASPLTIMSLSDETRILNAFIDEVSEDTNEFKIVKFSEKSIQLSFDYIDKKQWIILRIVHTGYIDDIKFKGKIKERGVVDDITHRRNTKTPEGKINLWFYIPIALFIALICVGFLCKVVLKEEYFYYAYVIILILMLLCEMAFLIPIAFVYRNFFIDIVKWWRKGEWERKNKSKKE